MIFLISFHQNRLFSVFVPPECGVVEGVDALADEIGVICIIFPRIIWKFQLKFVSLHQNNGRVPLLGMGCPRSEELSGSWQLFFCYGKIFNPSNLPSRL